MHSSVLSVRIICHRNQFINMVGEHVAEYCRHVPGSPDVEGAGVVLEVPLHFQRVLLLVSVVVHTVKGGRSWRGAGQGAGQDGGHMDGLDGDAVADYCNMVEGSVSLIKVKFFLPDIVCRKMLIVSTLGISHDLGLLELNVETISFALVLISFDLQNV